MAVEGSITSKKKHCQAENYTGRRKRKVTLLWVPGHIGNDIADEESKIVLEDDFLSTEKYPPICFGKAY
jgi:hypothetical protein